jgi:hypothetical protein
MEVIIVPPPRSHFGEPCPIATSLVTECLLDSRMHENAFDIAIRGRKLDEMRMDGRPPPAVDI